MSVVDRIASLAVSPEKEEARDRLLQAEQVLKEPGSASLGEARLAKLRALVDLDWFSATEKFADPSTNKDELVALAYSLYRLGKVNELRELVSHFGGDSASVGARLSLAQAEYKAGNLEEAKKLFESSLREVSAEDAADIAVNLHAIKAIQGITGSLQDCESGNFDEAFNLASALLVRGNVERALQMLQYANGLAEEEDDRHSAVAQAAYAHLLNGNPDEALRLLETITSSTPFSELPLALRIVIANNQLAATYKGGDIAAAHKALLSYNDFGKSGIELNADQRQIVARNELKLLARVGISSATRRARRHLGVFPNDVEPLAAAYHHTMPLKKVRKLAHAEDRAARVCLAASQGADWSYPNSNELRGGDFGQLASAIDSLKAEASNGASKNAKNGEAYFTSLGVPELVEAGRSLLFPNGEVTGKLLDSVAERISSVDAESLNFATPPQSQTSAHSVSKPVSHKKRSGKRKLPESYDPKKSPDPERWLAKQDRSDYKPKKKKTSQATQGAASVPDEPLPAAPASQIVGAKTKKKSKKKAKK